MEKLAELVTSFAEAVAATRVEVYNEISLQHEFGIFLRARFPHLRVQFERNVTFFFGQKGAFTKREIDISVYSPKPIELEYAVELKFPRNGQYPEQMFSFCKDIKFAEELKAAGFATTALLIFADDSLFYQGPAQGIYGFFRGERPLHGRIQKPTGSKDAEIDIRGTYNVRWRPILGSLKYALIGTDEMEPSAV